MKRSTIEIVSVSMKHGGSFHINHHFPMVFPWFFHGFSMKNGGSFHRFVLTFTRPGKWAMVDVPRNLSILELESVTVTIGTRRIGLPRWCSYGQKYQL